MKLCIFWTYSIQVPWVALLPMSSTRRDCTIITSLVKKSYHFTLSEAQPYAPIHNLPVSQSFYKI